MGMLEIPGTLRAGSIKMDADATGGGDSIGNSLSQKFSFVDSVPATDGIGKQAAYAYTITGTGNSFYYAKMTLSGKDTAGTHRTAEIEVFNGELQSLFLSNIDADEIDVAVYGDTIRVAPTFSETWFFTNHVEGYSGTLGNFGWGERAVYNATDSSNRNLQYFEIGIVSDTADFGGLNTAAAKGKSWGSNGSRGVGLGGIDPPTVIDEIDYISIKSLGNSLDFGELTQARYGINDQGASDGSRALMIAGELTTPTRYTTIDSINIQTTGDATDFGETTVVIAYGASLSDGSRAVIGAKVNPDYKHIEYITIGSLSNGVDWGGELTADAGYGNSAISSKNRGLFAGGYDDSPAANVNTICFINIGIPGNDATDFGNLTETAHYNGGGVTNGTRGIVVGGDPSDTIEYVTIDTNENAVDFGELSEAGVATGTSGA